MDDVGFFGVDCFVVFVELVIVVDVYGGDYGYVGVDNVDCI